MLYFIWQQLPLVFSGRALLLILKAVCGIQQSRSAALLLHMRQTWRPVFWFFVWNIVTFWLAEVVWVNGRSELGIGQSSSLAFPNSLHKRRIVRGLFVKWCPQVNRTGSRGPICPQHPHFLKVLSSTLHTQFQSSAPRFKGSLTVGWKQCMDLCFYCFAFRRSWTLNAGTFSAQPTFLWRGGTIKSHMEPSWDCRRDGPELGCFSP